MHYRIFCSITRFWVALFLLWQSKMSLDLTKYALGGREWGGKLFLLENHCRMPPILVVVILFINFLLTPGQHEFKILCKNHSIDTIFNLLFLLNILWQVFSLLLYDIDICCFCLPSIPASPSSNCTTFVHCRTVPSSLRHLILRYFPQRCGQNDPGLSSHNNASPQPQGLVSW